MAILRRSVGGGGSGWRGEQRNLDSTDGATGGVEVWGRGGKGIVGLGRAGLKRHR